MQDFDLSYTIEAMPQLLKGASITLGVAIAALMASLSFATVLSVIRAFRVPGLTPLISLYISFIRGTPVLLQIFLVFYVLPSVGIKLPPLVAGIAALSLNSAAIVTELIRGGLASIPESQIEVSRSFGFTTLDIWRHVLIPQVFNLIIPPLVNEFTIIVKMTPLVSVITVVELQRTSQQIFSANFRPVETLLGAALIYFLINFTASRIGERLEHRVARKLA